MSTERDNPDSSEEPGELLDDLNSIKALLDEDEGAAVPTLEDDATPDVPLLDDAIEEPEDKATVGMPDDTFKALLGDAWQDSVQELFNEARENIERNSQAWLPEDTDTLAAALKVRIDKSVREWLAETLQANIGLLRERIVAELSEELLGHMRQKFNLPDSEQD